VNNGPVQVVSTITAQPIKDILASMRVIYGGVSYSELMGYPTDQLTNEYIFPYYNNVAFNSQLRVGNLGVVLTTITDTLGTTVIDSYTLGAGLATRINYAGQNDGPLRVSSSATNILATTRVLYGSNSYSELMGYPVDQLTNEYIFPYYNNVALNSQLRVSNLGVVPTTITVTLGTTVIDSYTLGAGLATRINYAGQNDGPLRVASSATNIISTIRALYNTNSYSELMGYPVNQLTEEYWYPVYDNVSLNSQLRVSNVGAGSTAITVYSGGTQIDTYSLAAGAATRKNYTGEDDGPLQVVSDPEPILSTTRMLYTTPSFSSYYEMTGFPGNQLTTDYWFPWYNNTAFSSQLRFGIP
jgi:hypothetical protein